MLLHKLFLDFGYLNTLERLAIEEGWITSTLDGHMAEERMEFEIESTRDPLKGRILRLLTLFESVDSFGTDFDWSQLVEVGIVPKNSLMVGAMHSPKAIDEYGNNAETPSYERERILRYSEETASAFLKLFRKEIIAQHIRTSPKGLYTHQSRWFVGRNDLMNEYDYFVEHLEESIPVEKLSYANFINYIELVYQSIKDGLYFSCIDGHASFIPSVSNLMGPEPPPIPKLIDDLYYLARTRLSDEILVLPQPRSIDEAVEMKNTKEMKQFRLILSHWLDALQVGDESAEKKIRHDIGKANKDLERLKRIKRFQESPLNFWLNAIGGHIPIFSDVLNVFNTATGLYDMWVKHSNSWVLVVQNKR
jgi:hypothetical protein